MKSRPLVTVNGQCKYTQTNLYSPFAVQTVAYSNAAYSRDYQTVDSRNTPGYRKLSRTWLPEQPFKLDRLHQSVSEGKIQRLFINTALVPQERARTIYFGPAGGITGAEANFRDYPGNDPTNTAISRLQKMVTESSGSLGVSLAEANKTASMVTETATKLAKCFSELRKGRLGHAGNAIGLTFSRARVGSYRARYRRERRKHDFDSRQFAASQWLAMSYGWKPLLKDVQDQAENLARFLTKRQNVLREVKSSAKGVWQQTEVRPESNNLWKVVRTDDVNTFVRYTVRYKLRDDTIRFANTFGLNNPLLIAWELVPYSFVVDWFLPIGNYLENLTAYAGLSFHSGVKVTRKETKVVETTQFIGGTVVTGTTSREKTESASGSGRTDRLFIQRDTLIDFPYMSFPSFKDPRSISHATSAIALLQNAFLGSQKYR